MDAYEIYTISPKDGIIKNIHSVILSRQCWLSDLRVGKQGLLMVDVDDPDIGPHRIMLSQILSVTGLPGDPEIQIETENTVYILKKTKEGIPMIIRNVFAAIFVAMKLSPSIGTTMCNANAVPVLLTVDMTIYAGVLRSRDASLIFQLLCQMMSNRIKNNQTAPAVHSKPLGLCAVLINWFLDWKTGFLQIPLATISIK